MNYTYLGLSFIGAGLILLLVYRDQKKKQEAADFQADLMMKAARAKTEGKEQARKMTEAAQRERTEALVQHLTISPPPIPRDAAIKESVRRITNDSIQAIEDGPLKEQEFKGVKSQLELDETSFEAETFLDKGIVYYTPENDSLFVYINATGRLENENGLTYSKYTKEDLINKHGFIKLGDL